MPRYATAAPTARDSNPAQGLNLYINLLNDSPFPVCKSWPLHLCNKPLCDLTSPVLRFMRYSIRLYDTCPVCGFQDKHTALRWTLTLAVFSAPFSPTRCVSRSVLFFCKHESPFSPSPQGRVLWGQRVCRGKVQSRGQRWGCAVPTLVGPRTPCRVSTAPERVVGQEARCARERKWTGATMWRTARLRREAPRRRPGARTCPPERRRGAQTWPRRGSWSRARPR